MPEQELTPKIFARILSRAFSLYLLVWGLSDLLSLPEFIPSLLHYLQTPATRNDRSYWITYYSSRVAVDVIRSAALLVASGYLWKNGAFILSFFKEERPATSSDSEL